MIRKDIVEVSTEIAHAGLYLTPDLALFGHLMTGHRLLDAVQVIHDTQPLTSSYAKFGDRVSDEYHDTVAEFTLRYCDSVMAMAALARTQDQMIIALNAIVQVAVSIFLKTINAPDNAEHPRIIPHELENMRFSAAWKINQDAFHQMFLAEPWLSWIELMRGQYVRTRRTLLQGVTLERMKEFRECASEEVVPELASPQEHDQAKRAIKRAVKLHGKIYRKGLDDVRTLLKGKPVRIEGKTFDYVLSFEPGTLFQETIIRDTKIAPTSLEILNKKGVSLGNSCLYFEDTPILDHLLNVKLHSSNAETELDMVRAFHINKTTSAFYRDPILPDLKGLHDPVTGPLVTVENVLLHARSNPDRVMSRRIMTSVFYKEAKAALHRRLRFPKAYLDLLRRCSYAPTWSYITGRPWALALLEGRLNDGLFS